MKINCQIHEPMFDFNDKKYIRLIIPDDCKEIINRIHRNKNHIIRNSKIDNPIDGNILTIKVPFRYRRVMCEVKGNPVQSLIRGDTVDVTVEYMGVWNIGDYSGHSWKMTSIESSL